MKCIACGEELINPLSNRIFRCSNCKTLLREDPEGYYKKIKSVYDEEYYNKKYLTRYGKHVKDDFPNIRKLAERRLDIIENTYLKEFECKSCGLGGCNACNIRPKFSFTNKKLLDIGCGIGVFLEVAKERGFDVKGIDINKDIIYVVNPDIRENIEIVDIMDFNTDEKFDVISMWFVLEHIPYVEEVIKKVWNLLKYGGVFALSTPNGFGASSRYNLSWYLSVFPEDHLYEFSQKGISYLLRRNNFVIRRIVNTGFHPERISKNPFIKNIFHLYQRISGIGDTFEVYAVKRLVKN
ncbi:MAG: class I SAM-dependent methyltransferase [Brevinematia bacterium]